MSTTMQVPAFETGVIRLFAIDMPPDQMDAFDAKVALGASAAWMKPLLMCSRSATLRVLALLDIW